MGIAITLAQFLLNRGVAYELAAPPRMETASASAAARRLPADSVVKAVVLKGGDRFMLALLPASRHIQLTSSGGCLAATSDTGSLPDAPERRAPLHHLDSVVCVN